MLSFVKVLRRYAILREGSRTNVFGLALRMALPGRPFGEGAGSGAGIQYAANLLVRSIFKTPLVSFLNTYVRLSRSTACTTAGSSTASANITFGDLTGLMDEIVRLFVSTAFDTSAIFVNVGFSGLISLTSTGSGTEESTELLDRGDAVILSGTCDDRGLSGIGASRGTGSFSGF